MANNYNADDLTLIKRAANIPTAVTTHDTDLKANLTASYNWINLQLDRFTTVPLSTIPNIIKEIEADIAAGMFKEEKTEPVEGERMKRNLLRERGENALLEYIKTTYQSKGENRANFFRHGKSTARREIDARDRELETDL